MNKGKDKIREVISPVLEENGYRLVLAGYNSETLQILLERVDNIPITIGECIKMAKKISPILEENNLRSDNCGLEVSSAGIDRPLVVLEDFAKFVGHKARVEFVEPVNKKKKITGAIISVDNSTDDGVITFETQKETFIAKFDNIKSAKLVLTDELIAFQRSLIAPNPNSEN